MGLTEILLILVGLIVLIIVGKAVGRLFHGPAQGTTYKRENARPVKSERTTKIKVDPAPIKKKKWSFQNALNNTAQQNAQKNFQDIKKRNDAIRKQTDETNRKTTKRSRGW